jgi:hypothetical protein
MWKFGNKRGIQVEINIHVRETVVLLCLLLVVCCMCFVLLCLKNSCGNQLNNVEFKVELKRGTQRGNFKNKRGIERGTQEIKVEFQSGNQKTSNKLKQELGMFGRKNVPSFEMNH